jgi:hypothetical protein
MAIEVTSPNKNVFHIHDEMFGTSSSGTGGGERHTIRGAKWGANTPK